MPDERELGRRIKDDIIGIIKGSGEITDATVVTVSSTIRQTVREVAATGGTTADIAVVAVRAAISAASEVVGTTVTAAGQTVAASAKAATLAAGRRR